MTNETVGEVANKEEAHLRHLMYDSIPRRWA
jgi:hypothetical protein